LATRSHYHLARPAVRQAFRFDCRLDYSGFGEIKPNSVGRVLCTLVGVYDRLTATVSRFLSGRSPDAARSTMSFSVQEFWKLASDSSALPAAHCQQLAADFHRHSGGQGDATTVADWLVSRQVLSRYQAKVLLARRPGPFVYGDYKVLDRFDAGRLKGLFRAEHMPTGHRVCLQFLSGAAVANPQAMARLAQQCSAASSMHNPHAARTHQLVDLGAYKFIVLEDLVGRSLEEMLSTSSKLAPAEACLLARQVALGLAEWHMLGLVHGDVRPANLWLTQQKQLQVLPVSMAGDPFAPPTLPHGAGVSADQLNEAADYLAPELLAPAASPDARSDVYALGCTLYRMLTGRAAVGEGDIQTRLNRHATAEPPAANQVNRQVPGPVAQVVSYMLAKDPAARYQQAGHVAEALLPYLDPRAARVPPQRPVATLAAYDAWLRQQPEPAMPRPIQAVPTGGIPRATPVAAPAATFPSAGAIPVAQPVMAAPVSAVPTASPIYPPAQAYAPQVEVAVAIPPVSTSSGGYSVVAQRKAAQRMARRNAMFAAMAVAVLLAIGGGVAYLNWPKSSSVATEPGNMATTPAAARPVTAPDPKGDAKNPSESVESASATSGAAGASDAIVSLDDEPMWQSPTSGQPLDLSYFPAGARAFLAIRPADIWANEEARHVLTSLGIEEQVRSQLVRLAGSSPENIEQAIFGFGGAAAELYLVARTRESVDEEELIKNWGTSEPVVIANQRVFKAGGMTFFTPGEHRNKLIVAVQMADDKQIEGWLATAKVANTMRDLEVLRRASDDRRHVSLLFSPTFFGTSGKSVFSGPLQRLNDPLLGFLTSEMGTLPHGCLASVHLGSDLFGEVRLTPDSEAADAAKQYRQRVQGLTERMYDYVGGAISPYSAKILQRFPRWLEELDRYTRVGTSDKQVVLRSYLPAVAAHNLAFGTKLALLESPSGGMVAVANAPPAAAPTTLAEMLKQKYTLTFDRDSLERTLDLISKDTGVPITILGGDLQLEGITKNQSFGLDEKDKPIFEILKTIMQKANPDGKLIYVFGQEGDKEVLQVTTRAAAAKRGDKIPPELE
jgi:hypothetical protein